MSAVEYHHFYILQSVATARLWGYLSNIMWFQESNRYFCKIENFANGEITKQSFISYPSYSVWEFLIQDNTCISQGPMSYKPTTQKMKYCKMIVLIWWHWVQEGQKVLIFHVPFNLKLIALYKVMLVSLIMLISSWNLGPLISGRRRKGH